MVFGKHVNRYYLKYAPILLLGIIALIAVDYFQLKIPELYRQVINGMNSGYVTVNGSQTAFDMDYLLDGVCLPMIVIIVAMVTGRFLWRVSFWGSAIRVETDLRGRMFEHSRLLSQQYYQVNKVGNMMSLFTNDLETVQDCFGSGTLMFFDALILGVLAIYKMCRMDALLTALSFIPMVFMFAMSTIIGRFMKKKWELRQQAFSDLSDFSQESFSGISVIKAFVKEAKELSAFRKLNRDNEKTNVDFTRLSTLLNILVILFADSVLCIILGYGGLLVYKGRFNAGQLIEFTGYFQAIIWPVMAVSQLIDKRSRGKASLGRISELLDAGTDVVDADGVTELENAKGDIEFRHLTFRYPGSERDVLRDVSFTINAGENVGIVGRTGSGKTTLVDLILRTYNVPDGTLFIDGKDVNSLSIHSVREACAYVPQDNFLFSDTIARNIAFSGNEGDSESIKRAAVLSDVDENIIGFPDGYDTMLGERGVTISGGQKQRVSIARALMKNAPVLILDDSVSAVDTSTEKVILDNLRTERRGKTTILIALRISTVEHMDKIIFIDDGAVSAVGTHDELCESCPNYRRMVELQRLEDEGGENNNA